MNKPLQLLPPKTTEHRAADKLAGVWTNPGYAVYDNVTRLLANLSI